MTLARQHRNLLGCRARVGAALLLSTAVSVAGESDVVDAKARCDTARVCSFDVTVRHDDTGWDHYANHWRVIAANGKSKGKELGKRVLHHPHETEQPFTRSLSGVTIPDDTTSVILESHDLVHEYGGATVTVEIAPGS